MARLHMLPALLLAVWAVPAGALPLPNTDIWKKYCSKAELKESKLELSLLLPGFKSLDPYRSEGFDKESFDLLAAEVAGHGAKAMPCLIELLGERSLRLTVPLLSRDGFSLTLPHYPYNRHALAAIERLRDPAALPVLHKLKDEPDLRPWQRAAILKPLFALDAEFSADELARIFAEPELGAFFFKELLAAVQKLPKEQQASVLLGVLPRSPVGADTPEAARARAAAEALAETCSPKARAPLTDPAGNPALYQGAASRLAQCPGETPPVVPPVPAAP